MHGSVPPHCSKILWLYLKLTEHVISQNGFRRTIDKKKTKHEQSTVQSPPFPAGFCLVFLPDVIFHLSTAQGISQLFAQGTDLGAQARPCRARDPTKQSLYDWVMPWLYHGYQLLQILFRQSSMVVIELFADIMCRYNLGCKNTFLIHLRSPATDSVIFPLHQLPWTPRRQGTVWQVSGSSSGGKPVAPGRFVEKLFAEAGDPSGCVSVLKDINHGWVSHGRIAGPKNCWCILLEHFVHGQIVWFAFLQGCSEMFRRYFLAGAAESISLRGHVSAFQAGVFWDHSGFRKDGTTMETSIWICVIYIYIYGQRTIPQSSPFL